MPTRRKTTGNLKIVHERYDPKKNAQAAEMYKVREGCTTSLSPKEWAP